MADGPSGDTKPAADTASSSSARRIPRPAARGPVAGPRKPSRNRLTGRAGILALVLCAVMVTVAYPLRQYLAQRSQIDAAERQNQQTAQQVAALRTELAKWDDPAYVAIQARERLHYVKPGETGFIVPNPSAGTEPIGMPTASQQAWYDRLWTTVKSPSASPSATLSPSATPAP
jgi:cell division protein FtsB